MTEHTYDWWHRALAGEGVGGPALPVHDGVAHPGFYRMRRREKRGIGEGNSDYGPWLPVALFVHDGELVALVNDTREDAAEIWMRVCLNPVSEAAYRAARETGKWPDIDDGISAPPAPVGHNAPIDDADAMKDQIELVSAGISAYENIVTDDEAARAQSLRSRLLELGREADKKREAEKRPHIDAGKQIDARWQPLVKAAKAGADKLAAALSRFLTTKAREQEDAERQAQAAAAKAEAPPPEPAAPPPTQIKGGYGRAATVKVVKVVTAVTDWGALWGFMKEHPEVRELLTKLAQRAIDKGHTVPGVTVEEQRMVA